MTTPKDFGISLQFSKTLEFLGRGDRALLILRDHEGKHILGSKNAYPPAIYRLTGGGVEPNENPQVAAARELQEELGIERTPEEMEHVGTITVSIHLPNKTMQFHLFLYATDIGATEKLTPSDDLDGIVHLSREEVNALIDRFYDLTDLPSMSWSDYGKLYGRVHEIVLEITTAYSASSDMPSYVAPTHQ